MLLLTIFIFFSHNVRKVHAHEYILCDTGYTFVDTVSQGHLTASAGKG